MPVIEIVKDLDRHALIHKLEETGLEFDASEHEGHHDHDHEHAHHHHHEH